MAFEDEVAEIILKLSELLDKAAGQIVRLSTVQEVLVEIALVALDNAGTLSVMEHERLRTRLREALEL